MAHTSLLTKLFLIVHKPAEIFKPSGESAKVVKSDVADIMEEEEEKIMRDANISDFGIIFMECF